MHVVPWYSYSNCNRCTVTYVNLCTCCKCPPALAAAPLLKTYSTHQARGIGNANIHVMEWSGRRTGHRQRSLSKMETTAGGGGNQVLLYSSRQFSVHPKSSLVRERRGPQGTHAIATIKSALWTTKRLTIVFPWPAQIVSSTIATLIIS